MEPYLSLYVFAAAIRRRRCVGHRQQRDVYFRYTGRSWQECSYRFVRVNPLFVTSALHASFSPVWAGHIYASPASPSANCHAYARPFGAGESPRLMTCNEQDSIACTCHFCIGDACNREVSQIPIDCFLLHFSARLLMQATADSS